MGGHRLVEEEPAACDLGHGRVDLYRVERDIIARREHVLGPRVATAADHEDATRVGAQREGVVKGAVVGEHGLHAALVEVGSALVDASCLQHPHGLAIVVADLAHEAPPTREANGARQPRGPTAPGARSVHTRRATTGICRAFPHARLPPSNDARAEW